MEVFRHVCTMHGRGEPPTSSNMFAWSAPTALRTTQDPLWL